MLKKIAPLIILGSSNSNGNTYRVVSLVSELLHIPIIDLAQKNIGDFDYEFSNGNDDFLPLIKDILCRYDTMIFATPVYWYTMSGIMKRFLDRFSDLLKTEKETGRKLRGKNLAVISCGSDKLLKNGFHMPFIETAKYLGMNYIGDVHTWVSPNGIEENVKKRIDRFVKKIGTTV